MFLAQEGAQALISPSLLYIALATLKDHQERRDRSFPLFGSQRGFKERPCGIVFIKPTTKPTIVCESWAPEEICVQIHLWKMLLNANV